MEKVLVTGGAGYVGCALVPLLLEQGYEVTVLDILYFGDQGLPRHDRLKVVKGDICDTALFRKCARGMDYVIHMACISNDPSFELNPTLSKSVNYDSFEPMVIAAKEERVRRFLYVSSSSVYGVSDAPEVTEEHPLVPLTDYNKYKGMCEPLLFKHQTPEFVCTVVRPATVCGYSPRMRMDLSVNILTNHAVNKGVVTVLGGAQKRPNIHVDDIAELYVKMLRYPTELIAGQIFNASHENHTIAQIAEMVRKTVMQEYPDRPPIEIKTAPSNDPRSYHVTSKKIARVLGFRPERTIEDAVRGICKAFKQGKLPNSMTDKVYFNIQTLKDLHF